MYLEVVMKLILWSSVWCGYILLTQPIPTPTFLLWKGSNWTEASRHSPGGHKVVVVHHLDKCLHLGPVLDFLFAHSSCDFSREAINPSHQTVSIGLVLCTVIVVLQHKHQHLQLCFIYHAVSVWLVPHHRGSAIQLTSISIYNSVSSSTQCLYGLCPIIVVLQYKHQHLQLCFI